VEIAGRDAMDGRPRSIVIELDEIAAVLNVAVQPLLSAATTCIGEAPPDLANDLLRSGLLLVGGGSMLPGLDQLLAFAIGVPVHIPLEADRLVIRGAARCLGRDSRPRADLNELTFD
jgi:rod shape-determining protein MreB